MFLYCTHFHEKLIFFTRDSWFVSATLHWLLLKFPWFIHSLYLNFPIQLYNPGRSHRVSIKLPLLECGNMAAVQNSQECKSSTDSQRWDRMLFMSKEKQDEISLFIKTCNIKTNRGSEASVPWSNSDSTNMICLIMHDLFHIVGPQVSYF